MEEKLNLILKVLALRLRLEYGFTNPMVEELVKEIDQAVIIDEEVKKPNTSIPNQENGGLQKIFKKIRKGD